MFKRITIFAILIVLAVFGFVAAGIADEAVIVDINGDGSPDTVLASPDDDISRFQSARGYDENMRPILKQNDDPAPSLCRGSERECDE